MHCSKIFVYVLKTQIFLSSLDCIWSQLISILMHQAKICREIVLNMIIDDLVKTRSTEISQLPPLSEPNAFVSADLLWGWLSKMNYVASEQLKYISSSWLLSFLYSKWIGGITQRSKSQVAARNQVTQIFSWFHPLSSIYICVYIYSGERWLILGTFLGCG